MTPQFSEQYETPEEETAPETRSLFGPPPVIDGETEEAYEAFSAQIRTAVAPTDALEEAFMRDVVYYLWEVLRLRRLKGKNLQFSKIDGLREVLRPLVHKPDLEAFVDAWARRDPEAIEQVSSILEEANFDMEHVAALGLTKHIDDFEKIDRLISSAENRRNLALRELERHRESLARRVQNAAKVIEDAEFHVVEPALDDPQCA